MTRKILVIDDNEDVRENIAELLLLADYKVITASDGKSGAALAIDETPDLVICDIMMPVLDGYGTIHLLQKNPKTKHIPFIFLSAKVEKNDLRKGMEQGADDYLTKPFTGNELLNAIEGRFKRHERLVQNLQDADNPHTESSPRFDINEFLKDTEEMVMKKKQILYNEGNNASRLYYIVSGRIKQYRIHDDGKELIIGLTGSGDFMGFEPALEKSTYTDTAMALEDSEIRVIYYDQFAQKIDRNPAAMSHFLHLSAHKIIGAEEKLIRLAYDSLRKKVAAALSEVNQKFNPQGEPGFLVTISREELAHLAGTATESLVRTLGDFKSEKLIDITQGHIAIIDPVRLQNLPY